MTDKQKLDRIRKALKDIDADDLTEAERTILSLVGGEVKGSWDENRRNSEAITNRRRK